MEATKLNPIRVPSNHIMCWVLAHENLIATTTTCSGRRWVFIILKSGHHLYGYSGDSDAQMWSSEQFAEMFADEPDWLAAIQDIPALSAYYDDLN